MYFVDRFSTKTICECKYLKGRFRKVCTSMKLSEIYPFYFYFFEKSVFSVKTKEIHCYEGIDLKREAISQLQ